MWWWKFTSDLLAAQLEAQRVITLRMMKFAWGGAAAVEEVERATDEKLEASAEAAITLSSGGNPQNVLDDTRKVMVANIRRLSQP